MTGSRTSALSVLACLALWAGAASAQAPGRGATDPPVLSTVPTPLPGVTPQLQAMSGQPLQVSDLPPGTIAVRVIRGAFANGMNNHPVELHLGAGATTRTSMTGADGRAVFTGVTVGDQIQAATLVDGEYLESQRFEVPARGGVRLVLAAGVGAGGVPGAPASVAAASATTALAPIDGRWRVGLVVGLFVVAGGAVYLRKRRASAVIARAQSARQDIVMNERRPVALRCAECGTSNALDARFCTECGTRFTAHVVHTGRPS